MSGELLRLLWLTLRVAALAWAGLAVYMFLAQSRYIYYPSRRLSMTPAALNIEFDDITLLTADGESLGAWFVPAREPRGAVILCHGNAGNIGDRLPAVADFLSLGLSVLIFDYRGYGRSTGTPSEQGTYRDAAAAWDYLTDKRGFKPGSILVAGRSLGGGVASWLAIEKKPAALLMEAAFTSVPDLAASIYPYLPVRLMCQFRYDNISRMERLQCPVMIAHSRDDEMIPFSHGQRLFEAAPEPKVFHELSGNHNAGELGMEPGFRAALDAFIGRHLAQE